MSVTAVKEAFEEIPTRAQSALDTQWAYYFFHYSFCVFIAAYFPIICLCLCNG